MMENAIYSVISPEGCAAILWRESRRGSHRGRSACASPRPTACVCRSSTRSSPSRGGRAPRAEDRNRSTGNALARHLDELSVHDRKALKDDRYDRFRRLGAVLDEAAPEATP
jgi:acetyl-CoA carboxylase carboxyl transferase subunit alpha